MSLQETSTYKFFMEHQKFIHMIEGILIIILITGLWIMYFSGQELKKEISENCGWGKEDYQCYCQKNTALALKNELESRYGEEVIDVGISK